MKLLLEQLEMRCQQLEHETDDDARQAELRNKRMALICYKGVKIDAEVYKEILEIQDQIQHLVDNPHSAGDHEKHRNKYFKA